MLLLIPSLFVSRFISVSTVQSPCPFLLFERQSSFLRAYRYCWMDGQTLPVTWLLKCRLFSRTPHKLVNTVSVWSLTKRYCCSNNVILKCTPTPSRLSFLNFQLYHGLPIGLKQLQRERERGVNKCFAFYSEDSILVQIWNEAGCEDWSWWPMELPVNLLLPGWLQT